MHWDPNYGALEHREHCNLQSRESHSYLGHLLIDIARFILILSSFPKQDLKTPMANLRMRDPLFAGTKVEENVFCRCRVHSNLWCVMDECGSTAYGSADRFRLSQITACVDCASNMEWLSRWVMQMKLRMFSIHMNDVEIHTHTSPALHEWTHSHVNANAT